MNEVLRVDYVWVCAELVVLACPMPVQQRFLFLSTTGAHPEVSVLGGSLSIPHIVCHYCSEGIGFINFAVRQQAVMDGLCAGEVGKLSVPQTAVGLVW